MTMMKLLFIMAKTATTTSATTTTINNACCSATTTKLTGRRHLRYNSNWFSRNNSNRSPITAAAALSGSAAFVDVIAPTTSAARLRRSSSSSSSSCNTIIGHPTSKATCTRSWIQNRRTTTRSMTTSQFDATSSDRGCNFHQKNDNASSSQSALFSSSSSSFSSSSSEATGVESIPAEIQRTLAKQPIVSPNDESVESSDDNSNNNDDNNANTPNNNKLPYYIYESEQTIKKSRFIGLARYANNWSDAFEFINEIKTKVHPKARHWCFAYRGSIISGGSSGSGSEADTDDDDDDDEDDNTGSSSSSFDASSTTTTITERASDDGEPTGTAGQPILNSLKTEGNLIDVVVMVIRYSGGIKLGAGGLIRAYGGTARQVLQENTQHQLIIIPKQTLIIENLQPKYVGQLYDIASKYNASIISSSNDTNNFNNFNLICDCDVVPTIKERLLDWTRGSITIRS
jgi:putative IMPACT (imprinted ancient) family translation regulator